MDVLRLLGRIYKDKYHYSLFCCPRCATEVIRQTSNGKMQKSCGCKNIDPKRFREKGKATALYRKWVNMKTRCSNPNATQSPWYGDKGISYVKEWQDFDVFCEWAIKNGYIDGKDMSLSRKDHDKEYGPDNCEFVDRIENCREAQSRRWKKQHFNTPAGKGTVEKAAKDYELYAFNTL